MDKSIKDVLIDDIFQSKRPSYNYLICLECKNEYDRKRKHNEKIKCPEYRKADEFSMSGDPTSNHFDCCHPIYYDDVIKTFHIMENKKTTGGAYGFPLERTRGRDTFVLMHRLNEDPSKCYRFHMITRSTHNKLERSEKTRANVYCGECDIIRRRTNKEAKKRRSNSNLPLPTYKLGADCFLDSPLLNHLPGCIPFSTKDLVVDNEVVEEDSARKLIRAYIKNGNFNVVDFKIQIQQPNSMNINISEHDKIDLNESRVTNECNMEKTNNDVFESTTFNNGSVDISSIGFNPVVVQKQKDITYFYRLRHNPSLCYRFFAQGFNKSSMGLLCGTCLREGVQRKSDGFSMHEDPELNHSPKCKPDKYSDVVQKYHRLDPESIGNQGKYDFPITKFRKHGEYFVLHRLKKDPTKCYRFFFAQKRKEDFWTLNCTTCTYINRRSQIYTNYEEYFCNEDSFLDDPTKCHLTDCQPLLLEKVLRHYTPVEKQLAAAYLDRKFIGPCKPRMEQKQRRKRSKKTKMQEIHNEDTLRIIKSKRPLLTSEPNMADEYEENEDKFPITEDSNVLNCLGNNDIKLSNSELQNEHVGKEECEHITPNTHCKNNKDVNIKQEPAQFGLQIKEEPYDEVEAMDTAKTFYHEFEVPFFNEQEFKVNIEGSMVNVQFQRKCSSEYSLSGSLNYSLQLPKSIDVSTIRIMWNQGIVELIAQYL